MRRKTVAVAVSAGLASLGLAAPAGAHEGHASCKGFGEFASTFAQTAQPAGQVVRTAAPHGGVAALVAAAHEGECEKRES